MALEPPNAAAPRRADPKLRADPDPDPARAGVAALN